MTDLEKLEERIRELEVFRAEHDGALKLGRWVVISLLAVGGLVLGVLRLWP